MSYSIVFIVDCGLVALGSNYLYVVFMFYIVDFLFIYVVSLLGGIYIILL